MIFLFVYFASEDSYLPGDLKFSFEVPVCLVSVSAEFLMNHLFCADCAEEMGN